MRDEYRYLDRDDPNYYGIRDVDNLFSKADEKDYHETILVKISFKKIYKGYESKGDKNKNLSAEKYLNMIKPYLRDMINNDKAEESKIQLNMYINFISSKDTGETRTTYIWSDNEEIR